MSAPARPVPAYRRQKRRGKPDLAFVQLNGTRHYLGRFDSEESHREYRALIAEWQSSGCLPAAVDLTVVELVDWYWSHAKTYYRKPDGSPTSELGLPMKHRTEPDEPIPPEWAAVLTIGRLITKARADARRIRRDIPVKADLDRRLTAMAGRLLDEVGKLAAVDERAWADFGPEEEPWEPPRRRRPATARLKRRTVRTDY